jgi:hypothetical protein
MDSRGLITEANRKRWTGGRLGDIFRAATL